MEMSERIKLGLFLFNHRQGFRSARCRAYLLPLRSQHYGDEHSGRPHIVHNQDAMGWERSRLIRQIVRFLRNNIACLKNRKANGELAALSQPVACRFDGAAVHFHKTLHEG